MPAIRRTRLVLLVLVAVTALAACGGSGQQVARWSDEAIEALSRITGRASDDAARGLDDVARVSGAGQEAVERATVAWANRFDGMVSRIESKLTEPPDGPGQVRSFVVGTTCEVVKEQAKSPLGITESKLTEIVNKQRRSSGLPLMAGLTSLAGEVAKEISAALAEGDVTNAAPGLTREVVCAAAAG